MACRARLRLGRERLGPDRAQHARVCTSAFRHGGGGTQVSLKYSSAKSV